MILTCFFRLCFFMQLPMRRSRICFTGVFFAFFVFFRPSNMRQPFSGTAERIFVKLSPNDGGGNVFEMCHRLANGKC